MAILAGGNTMMRWAEKMTGYSDLRRQASETRVDVPSPEKLGFPCYRSAVVPLCAFLESPHQVVSSVDSDRFWFQLLPPVPSEPKVTISDLPRSEIISSITDSSKGKRPDKYRLFLSEFATNAWGGNIVISDDGSVVAEFIRGLQGPLSAEEKQPDIRITSRPGTKVLDYFERGEGSPEESLPQAPMANQRLRHALWNAISYVRKTPGYHELALLEGDLRPVFFDNRLSNPLYQIPAQLS